MYNSIMSKIFKIILIIFSFLIFGYFYLARPYRVVGKPVSPFTKGQLVLASKIPFYFRDPKVGDRIIFYPVKGSTEYIGIIVSIEDNKSIQIYNVDSATEKGSWQISQEKILSYIWYPLSN